MGFDYCKYLSIAHYPRAVFLTVFLARKHLSQNGPSIAHYPRAVFLTIEPFYSTYQDLHVYCPLSSGCLPNSFIFPEVFYKKSLSIAHYPRAVFLTRVYSVLCRLRKCRSIAHYPRAVFLTSISIQVDYVDYSVYCPLSSGCLPNTTLF